MTAKPATASELHDRAEAIAAGTPEPATGLAALRVPFPPEKVGKLPRITCKDCSDSRSRVCGEHRKSKCAECDNWITERHVHLDFVGHGHVTERLLDVDPYWEWQPFALDAQGLPALDRFGNLWIRLTVCGVTRPGVGDGATMKVLIGDALRNAAMRFGVALNLWARGSEDEKTEDGEKLAEPAPAPWNKNQTKAALRDLLGGDVDEAKHAWEYASGDSLTEFGQDVAQRIADAWLGRPMDEPAPVPDSGETA